jgi:hypothetical protein
VRKQNKTARGQVLPPPRSHPPRSGVCSMCWTRSSTEQRRSAPQAATVSIVCSTSFSSTSDTNTGYPC